MPGKKSLQGLPPLIRFWDKVERDKSSGCWLWNGARKSEKDHSYPLFWDTELSNSPMHAIAWAMEVIRGVPRPRRGSGNQISHQPDKCKHMSLCVNPHHAEVQSVRENCMLKAKETRESACAKARSCITTKLPRMADCHPDRRHYGRGLCDPCWRKSTNQRENRRARIQIRMQTEPGFRDKLRAAQRAHYHARKRKESQDDAA